jgi:hypothetical protein
MVSRARASLCVEASQNVAVRRSAMGEKSRVRTYDRAFDFFSRRLTFAMAPGTSDK